ncbi:Calcipressin [Epithele typhae]|uniref:Calcipressin n=1 Tax=Epithele typhae TaxID=378194 RepID=UPI0020089884|nr:Calcipressin [Epithele typhae]KAH9914495.1 Calcipressin [Epithele typhae]
MPHLSLSIPGSPRSPSSPPSLTMSSPSVSARTNTLVVTRLPPHFFEPIIQDALRSHFETYGPLHTWAPIRGFARVIMVYFSEEDAEIAKETNDGLVLGDMQDQPDYLMRVYRADPTPIESDETHEHNHYLRPPVNEKNFLISPPGSPPVGWEPIREDPPNSTPLAHDLIAALRKLEIEAAAAARGPGLEVDGDVRMDGCDDWAYGDIAPSRVRNAWRPTPTSMPPVPVSA